MGGEFGGECTHVHVRLSPFTVHLKLSQHCSSAILIMDCSPPGSSVHGIFQARVLEWGAIAFSEHKGRLIILPDFKLYYEAVIIKTA